MSSSTASALETTVAIPDELRRSVGAGGPAETQWLAELPKAVERLCDAWGLRPRNTLAGGSASLILSVTRDDDTSAVLKLGRPHGGSLEGQARVLRLADGRGYARLLAYDDAANALLTEKLGPSLASEGRDADAQIELLVDALRSVWRPTASSEGWVTGAQKAAWLATFIEEEAVPSLVQANTVRVALSFARECEAAYEPSDAVVVHGDAHSDNLLAIRSSPVRTGSSIRTVCSRSQRTTSVSCFASSTTSCCRGTPRPSAERDASESPSVPASMPRRSGAGPFWNESPPASTSSAPVGTSWPSRP